MFKNLIKKVKSFAKKAAPYAGLVAGAFGLNPMAAAGIGALLGGMGGGGMKGAMMGGLGGYMGGKMFGAENPLFNTGFGREHFFSDKVAQNLANKGFLNKGVFANMNPLIGKGGNIFDTAIKEKGMMDYLPLVGLGTGLAYAGGLFDEPPIPEDAIPKEYKYNAATDPLKNINQKYANLYNSYSPIPSSSIYGYLNSIGAGWGNKNGGVMAFADGGRDNPPMEQMIVPNPNLPSAQGVMQESGILSLEELEMYIEQLTMMKEAGELSQEQYQQAVQMVMEKAGQMKAAEGGIAKFNYGGEIMGPGTGREDIIPGKIVDKNTGQTSDMLVSNNEHIIPEYTLYAMGGGDTEKGHDMMNQLRSQTKKIADKMGYDFKGAENGSVNYG